MKKKQQYEINEIRNKVEILQENNEQKLILNS